MTLYGLLGAATSAMDSYDALDIKHIQNDTLSGKSIKCQEKYILKSDQTISFHAEGAVFVSRGALIKLHQ